MWFVYVIMIGMYSDGTQDTYLYTDPTHSSLEECQQWVYANATAMRQDMMREFDGKRIERVFCIEQERFKEFLEQSQGEQA